jgi:hypothetical protein
LCDKRKIIGSIASNWEIIKNDPIIGSLHIDLNFNQQMVVGNTGGRGDVEWKNSGWNGMNKIRK